MSVIAPPYVPQSAAFASRDIIPASDLIQWQAACASSAASASTTGARYAIVGDSTGLFTGQNNIAPGMNLAGLIFRGMQSAYRGVAFTPYDRSIGGATTAMILMSGTQIQALGTSLPTWFTSPSQPWLSYVANAKPDLVIINAGINDGPGLSQTGIKAILQNIGNKTNFPITPSILFVINTSTVLTFNSGTPNWIEGLQAAASYMRAVSRSGPLSLGATDANLLNVPQIGMLDLGRMDAMARLGFDPCEQALYQQIAGQTVSGSSFSGGTTYTFPQCDGDFDINLTFPGQGATLLSGRQIRFNIGFTLATGTAAPWVNFVNSAGNFASQFFVGGGTNTISMTNGPSIGTGDVNLRLTKQQERLTTTLNGTTVFDQACAVTGGQHNPQLVFSADASAVSMVINSYSAGKRRPTASFLSDAQTFGAVGGLGPNGGNGHNHMSSIGIESIMNPVVLGARFR